MKRLTPRRLMQILSGVGMAGCAVLLLLGWRAGILQSPEAMAAFVRSVGKIGIIVFILFQAVQVVLPILPGNLGCLAGVLMFGPIGGFLCNYIGICIGSAAAFGIARVGGKPLLERIFSPKLLARYRRWTNQDSPFEKLFAAAIFLPVAPDDFLCWLAGTTDMPFRRFMIIILLGKPAAIAIYSWGLEMVWRWVVGCRL